MHEKSQRVGDMFNRIAARYDLLNHLLSGGTDFYWRKVALDTVGLKPEAKILDLCVGTADLALGAMRRKAGPEMVIGVDLALGMMRIGQKKAAQLALGGMQFVCGNAEELPFKEDKFDGAMVAFGVRNLADIPAGLTSIRHTLKPGGRLVVLELSRPGLAGFRDLYQVYFRHVLPRLGGLISGDGGAYSYLHTSVMDFPNRERFIELMEGAGFTATGYRDLSLGIATIYWGDK
ncbi:uncharacterized protein METZ01_LOCUS450974 [marine metagenome]|uniref:Demethylmenaquinone methyltransferase n=1 Tax=marine metagenome TaxID=408172 RepID=A0A382ZS34_9ZZZZ